MSLAVVDENSFGLNTGVNQPPLNSFLNFLRCRQVSPDIRFDADQIGWLDQLPPRFNRVFDSDQRYNCLVKHLLENFRVNSPTLVKHIGVADEDDFGALRLLLPFHQV